MNLKIFILLILVFSSIFCRAESSIEDTLGIDPSESKARRYIESIEASCRKRLQAEKFFGRKKSIKSALEDKKVFSGEPFQRPGGRLLSEEAEASAVEMEPFDGEYLDNLYTKVLNYYRKNDFDTGRYFFQELINLKSTKEKEE